MDAHTPINGFEAAHQILAPERQTLPLVFASPHSGSHYPPDFLAGNCCPFGPLWALVPGALNWRAPVNGL